ncbi:hypothetical protein ABPG72_013803 [Tetrahymena utriculariae]
MENCEEKIFFRFQSNNEISELLNQIMLFKQLFFERVSKQIEDDYEVNNIWSQFIIRYLQYPDYCLLFKNQIQITADYYLLQHLTKKGFDFQKDSYFLRDLQLFNNQISSKFNLTMEKIAIDQEELSKDLNIIIYKQKLNNIGEYSYNINDYNVLLKRYNNRQSFQYDNDKTAQVEANQLFSQQQQNKDFTISNQSSQKINYTHKDTIMNQKIFLTLFWYDYIGIQNGQQWSLNSEVFDLLKQHLGINTEVFASPFNSNLENYFSLFESDKYFGSLGNFNKNYLNIQQSFQANPPFIDNLFTLFASQIMQILELNTQNNREVGCVIVFPWQDNQGYYQLQNSDYFIDEIELLKNAHYYTDQSSCSSIKSKFNTYILILGNNYFKDKYLQFPYLSDSIVEAFQIKKDKLQLRKQY